MNNFTLKELPPKSIVETPELLKQLIQSHRFLAELKGTVRTIPNQSILINTLPLLEAKDSSAIENIITTHDELYKQELFEELFTNSTAKEVNNYAVALNYGFKKVKENLILNNNTILEIQAIIEQNDAGFRKLSGTELKNSQTGKVVYTPPQNPKEILQLMKNLEKFINEDAISNLDPLIKMAIVHFQFESIHPFYDGNGRTGRVLNILHLVLKGLLDLPVLYLSRYIIETKSDYYRLIQDVRDNENWNDWIIYLLKGIEETSKNTIRLVTEIRDLMQNYKIRIRKEFKFYSQDLLNNLFNHPYTKIEFLEKDLNITRKTAAKYLEELSDKGFLKKEKIGKFNFYINEPLYQLFIKS
jgi:Fic family protein